MRYSVLGSKYERYNVCNLWLQSIVCGIDYEGGVWKKSLNSLVCFIKEYRIN
jgi:hypothetical protein